jgi:hypothetical protein
MPPLHARIDQRLRPRRFRAISGGKSEIGDDTTNRDEKQNRQGRRR